MLARVPNSFKQPHFTRKHCNTATTTDSLYLRVVSVYTDKSHKSRPKSKEPDNKSVTASWIYAEYAVVVVVVVSTEPASQQSRYQRRIFKSKSLYTHFHGFSLYSETLYINNKNISLLLW